MFSDEVKSAPYNNTDRNVNSDGRFLCMYDPLNFKLICRYQQIMHYHMQNEEYGKVIDACKRYGEQESCLWEQALGYFARKEEDCRTYISEVLQHIDQNNLMPPLLGEFESFKTIIYTLCCLWM